MDVRGGLAALFVTTGVSHFVGMRAEHIGLVPPALPEPALFVTITGVLELLFLAATLAVLASHVRGRRLARGAIGDRLSRATLTRGRAVVPQPSI